MFACGSMHCFSRAQTLQPHAVVTKCQHNRALRQGVCNQHHFSGMGLTCSHPRKKRTFGLTGFAANVAHAKHTQIHLSEDLRFLSSSGSTVIGDSRGIQVPAPRSRTSPSQVVIEIAKLSGAFNTNRLKHDSGEQDQIQPREPKYTFT